jgi:hypothetical protein
MIVISMEQKVFGNPIYKTTNKKVEYTRPKDLHSVGFEPTSTNTLVLETNALDRSAKNAILECSKISYLYYKIYIPR